MFQPDPAILSSFSSKHTSTAVIQQPHSFTYKNSMALQTSDYSHLYALKHAHVWLGLSP